MAKLFDIAKWWDLKGPYKALHSMNPLRIEYINNLLPSRDLKILDFGCGAGLLAGPLATIGYDVTGVDSNEYAIRIARERHKDVRYLSELPSGESFDAILMMEVLEHLEDPIGICEQVKSLLNPGGIIIFSTINRNIISIVFAKFFAEYILRIAPKGIHDFKKFLKPSEVLYLFGPQCHFDGLVYDPIRNSWKLSKCKIMNYIGYYRMHQ